MNMFDMTIVSKISFRYHTFTIATLLELANFPICTLKFVHSYKHYENFDLNAHLPLEICPSRTNFYADSPENADNCNLYSLYIAFDVLFLWVPTETGRAMLQAVCVTAAIVVGLTLYTFWAARKGLDFSFLGPFLFACLPVLLIFITIQVLDT